MRRDQLTGGMQERLHRQELLNFAEKVKERNDKIKLKEKNKDKKSFGISSFHNIEALEDFEEPVFRKIRSKRGFFAYE